MEDKLLKPYNPNETEARIYKKWEDSGYFNPDICITKEITKPDAKPFTIIMPPPNITGVLHMGHALMLTLEDIMIRMKRMQGYRTLWLPGTDHAAIATQARVEKDISKKEGKSRYDLGREELLKRIDKFVQETQNTILSQIRVMGSSCDWSREAFTLDNVRSLAVRTMFKKMYDDGLIYRGNRIVNWDPKGQTTVSDDEVVHEERTAKMYTFRYSKDFPVSISTTRPETKLGDTAVAVHPDDARYQKFIGKEYDVDFAGTKLHLKIVADSAADPAFGTGAVGVTPAHSQTDWEIAERHSLPVIQVIDERAKIMVGLDTIKGKKTTEAREAVVAWLREQNLIEKEEDVKQNVSIGDRTGGTIEPIPKLQWFINVNKPIAERGGKTLKQLMREAVESGKIKIVPDYFNKTYFHWIDSLRDWCISRQIWYGHRVPVWYRGEETYVGTEMPAGEDWTQDPDTLDTWFSSGLWTFSTLGWPNKTKDLEIYHPTDVLETGYDILFFWVARMILMTEYALGTVPFHTVYLHGTVRDGQGRKMSKSLGNGMDPLDIARDFGADAGRMALVVGTAPGTDSKISVEKVRGYKNFSNKLWNISRFILENTEGIKELEINLSEEDQNLLSEANELAKNVTADMEAYRFHLASEKIYHFVWDRLASEIIEQSKSILKNGNQEADSRKKLLLELLRLSLKLLHPFVPFVTEELWSLLPKKAEDRDLLMIEKWPC